jgi:cell division protein FtsB
MIPQDSKKVFSQGESMRRRPRTSLSPGQLRRVVGIGACLVVIAILWVIFAPRMGVYSLLHQRSTLARLRVENIEIEEKNGFLQKEIERIKNDPEYFEKIARDKYGLLKENEMVFEFTPSKKEKKK